MREVKKLFMKGNPSMNQGVIDVELKEVEDKVVLTFQFSPNAPDQAVNLDEEVGQQELKTTFTTLLRLLISDDLQLKLVIQENFKKQLYIEVIEEYLKDLNSELIDVRQRIISNIKKR